MTSVLWEPSALGDGVPVFHHYCPIGFAVKNGNGNRKSPAGRFRAPGRGNGAVPGAPGSRDGAVPGVPQGWSRAPGLGRGGGQGEP